MLSAKGLKWYMRHSKNKRKQLYPTKSKSYFLNTQVLKKQTCINILTYAREFCKCLCKKNQLFRKNLLTFCAHNAVIYVRTKRGELMPQKKIGRPKVEKPLTDRIFIRVDDNTKMKLEKCTKKLNSTISDVVRKGIDTIYDNLDN